MVQSGSAGKSAATDICSLHDGRVDLRSRAEAAHELDTAGFWFPGRPHPSDRATEAEDQAQFMTLPHPATASVDCSMPLAVLIWSEAS